ncbi:MAG: FliM/FliN family flagellar motor switch protein, partial [Peptostreptococcaceae bacterium]|nr:FliM/FliN family flagellar motor switch protein [Peptostreptococcaceae bacterium]
GILDFELKDDNMDEDLVLMNFSKDIGFCTIDRLLGGLGKPLKEDREYTEIEMGLLEHIIKEIVSLMKNVWANYIEMAPKLVKLETNSRILQGISADENIVIVGMSILINETQGKIRICIPEATLDAIFKKRNTQNKKNARRGDQVSETQRRADIIKEISKSEFELTGVLGKVEILSKDLIDLEVGDIIKLKNAENSLVEISVGNVPWFRGELGSFNKKRAISIKESVEKGSEPV